MNFYAVYTLFFHCLHCALLLCDCRCSRMQDVCLCMFTVSAVLKVGRWNVDGGWLTAQANQRVSNIKTGQGRRLQASTTLQSSPHLFTATCVRKSRRNSALERLCLPTHSRHMQENNISNKTFLTWSTHADRCVAVWKTEWGVSV